MMSVLKLALDYICFITYLFIHIHIHTPMAIDSSNFLMHFKVMESVYSYKNFNMYVIN